MEFNENKNYLIVADRKYKSVLLKAKAKMPKARIKIIDKNELLNLLSISYSKEKDPITYLLSKGKYDYSQIKKILNILRIGDFQNEPMFLSIYNELKDNGYISFDPYGKKEIERFQEVLLFEADEDWELKEFLNRQGIGYSLIHFSDFGYRNRYEEKQPLILGFENKFKQYLYIFSDIRARLQEDSSLQNRIVIHADGTGDLFYIGCFRDIFKIPVRTNVNVPLVSNELVHQNLIAFHKNQNFEFVTEVTDSTVKQLQNDIEHYELKKLPFRFAYASLMEILSSQSQSIEYDNKGISITTDMDFQDSIVYSVCFQHDVFYKEYDDNNIVSDDLLVKMHVNPSYVKTRMSRQMSLNYIMQNDIALLSRVELHLQDKIYNSQFLEELGWKINKAPVFNSNGIYTDEAIRLANADHFDKEGNVSIADGYRDYSHRYTPSDVAYQKDHYSVSALKNYYECPFYFYLENVLGVSSHDTNKDDTAMRIGNLAHKVFEKIYSTDEYKSDFDKAYENAFEAGIMEYRKESKGRNEPATYKELTDKERATVEFIRYWLKDVVKAQREILDLGNSKIIDEKAEEEIHFTLEDSEGAYPFIGYIDKLVYSQGESKEKYVTVIDYKTGTSGDFDIGEVCVGGSLQLPLYRYALESSANRSLASGYTIGGFAIQHIYLNSIPIEKGCYSLQAVKKATNIGSGGGITICAPDYIESLDKTTKYTTKKEPDVVKYKDGDFLTLNYSYDDMAPNPALELRKGVYYPVERLFRDAVDSAIEKLKKMRLGDFGIAPTVVGKDGRPQCSYCRYKDICYHSKKDVVDLLDEIGMKLNPVIAVEE